MNLQTVHHIAIIGSDYEKSKHFYVDLLGFSVIWENYRKERDDYKIDLQLQGMELELFIIKNCPKRPSYPEAYTGRKMTPLIWPQVTSGALFPMPITMYSWRKARCTSNCLPEILWGNCRAWK